jgi:hypothetical protein
MRSREGQGASQGVVQGVQDAVEILNDNRGDGGVQVRPEAGEEGKEVMGGREGSQQSPAGLSQAGLSAVVGRRDRVARMRSLEACRRVEAVRV